MKPIVDAVRVVPTPWTQPTYVCIARWSDDHSSKQRAALEDRGVRVELGDLPRLISVLEEALGNDKTLPSSMAWIPRLAPHTGYLRVFPGRYQDAGALIVDAIEGSDGVEQESGSVVIEPGELGRVVAELRQLHLAASALHGRAR